MINKLFFGASIAVAGKHAGGYFLCLVRTLHSKLLLLVVSFANEHATGIAIPVHEVDDLPLSMLRSHTVVVPRYVVKHYTSRAHSYLLPPLSNL